MIDNKVNETVNNWRKRIERIQERGHNSVRESCNGNEQSYGLYEWLELNDIIQEMDRFVIEN